jgi:hypothetical protein
VEFVQSGGNVAEQIGLPVGVRSWNEKLLFHYFGVRDDDSPIRSICVTAEELRVAAQVADKSADEVQQQFLQQIRGSLSAPKSGAAFEKRMASQARVKVAGSTNLVPGGFAFLVASCLAANEVIEDEDNDGLGDSIVRDFREVLARLLDVNDVAISKLLASTWEDLQEYLNDEPVIHFDDGGITRLRKLTLPNPGAETHIGYSKKIVFPSRRDQGKLIEKLKDNDVVEMVPAVDDVLSIVARFKSTFSKTFQIAFDEFREMVRAGRGESELISSPFWNAVLSACSNELLIQSSSANRHAILLHLSHFENEFYLAHADGTPSKKFAAQAMGSQVDGWESALTISDSDEDVISHVLQNSSGLGPLTSLINGGVIPFRPLSGLYESHSAIDGEATVALIRDDILPLIKQTFDSRNQAEFSETDYEGWTLCENIVLRTLLNDELEAAGLLQTNVLRRRFFRSTFKILSLFRHGDEYIGSAKLHPKIDAPNATKVSATVESEEVLLSRSGKYWIFPERDFFGRTTIEVIIGDQRFVRDFRFVSTPASDSYLLPSTPDALLIETCRGVSALSTQLASASERQLAVIPDTVHRVYWGRRPGEFVESSDDAILEVTYFGENSSIRIFPAIENADRSKEVEDSGLVRAWRKKLTKLANNPPQGIDESVIHTLRRLATPESGKRDSVPAKEGFSRPPTPYDDEKSIALLRQSLLGAAGFRSLRRMGIPINDWMDMLKLVFGLEWRAARLVHRAWLESGIIDEFVHARSPGVVIFARRPRIEVFESEDGFVGAVSGLVMPERFVALEDLAKSNEIMIATNVGPSKYVPPHLRVWTNSFDSLTAFAREAGLDLYMLSENPFEEIESIEKGMRPTRGYAARKNYPTFELPDGASVALFKGSGSPLVWECGGDSTSSWTYSAAHSEHLAAVLGGAENLVQISAVDMVAKYAFLPLPVARWITMVSGVPSGPDEDNTYLYRFASPALRKSFMQRYHAENSKVISFWKEQLGDHHA